MSESIGTREFAAKYNATQTTVTKWCKEGKIANANQDAKGSPWHIPNDAVPPASHRKKQTERITK